MKKCLLVLSCLLIYTSSRAEDLRHYVSAGYGFPNIALIFLNLPAEGKNYQTSGRGPFHLKYENRVAPFFGVGMNINHMTYQVNYTNDVLDTAAGRVVPNKVRVSNTNTAFNFHFNVHFINPENNDKLDIYWGMGLGFKLGSIKIEADYPSETLKIDFGNLNKLGFESTFGVRYFFDENLGIYSELGLAKSIVQVGFTGRF